MMMQKCSSLSSSAIRLCPSGLPRSGALPSTLAHKPCTHVGVQACDRDSPTCAFSGKGQRLHASRARSTTGNSSVASVTAPAVASEDTSALRGRFVIPAEEVKQLVAQQGGSVEELLFSLIKPAALLARPPISGYHVGAVGLGSSGAVYVGVNLEFPKAPLNNSVHGEQFLLVNCLKNGESGIEALAVSAAPCGHCRQFYCECVNASNIKFLFGASALPKMLDDLLPEKFGPTDLSDEPFPLLLERQDHRVTFRKEASDILQQRGADAVFQLAAAEALTKAQQAYAPYTRCPSGASIITHDGRVFSGGYIESAAYNPSLSPFHAAVVDAVTGGIPAYSEIKEVVLAEVRGALVKHKSNIKLLLRSIAPHADLTLLPLS